MHDTIYVMATPPASSILNGTVDWVAVGAIATVLYMLAFCTSMWWIKKQFEHQRQLTQATILQNVYELVRATREYREKIYLGADDLRKIKELPDFRMFRQDRGEKKDLYEAFKEVTNCYQYIGLLVQHNLIDEKLILDEGYTTIARVHGHVGHLVKLEQEEIRQDYKKPYMDLAGAATKRWKGTISSKVADSTNI